MPGPMRTLGKKKRKTNPNERKRKKGQEECLHWRSVSDGENEKRQSADRSMELEGCRGGTGTRPS